MVPFYFLKQKKNGFTLIELMVAVAIMAVVSSFIFASIGKKQQDAIRAAQKLALDIRTAQNKSLAPTDVPVCVYGVHGDVATSYFLYKRPTCPAPRSVAVNNQYDGNTANILDTVALSGASIITAVPFDVSFEAPEPITYINGATGTPPLMVTFQGQGLQHSVVINRFGRVEIQ